MAQIISKKVLEDIRSRNDIVDVIGTYFTLKRAGTSFKSTCPFHKEKTPSFHVNPQRQIYHCFGCGAGGDVFKFLMQKEGVDFGTAVRMLAEKAGIRLEFEDGKENPQASIKESLYRLHLELAQFYQRCLTTMKNAEPARRYLHDRDLPAPILEEFMIGYAPDRWDACLQWAEKKGYPTELLETAGLIIKRPNAPGYYDRFRNRITFPICDEQNRVIGFSARALVSDGQGAKYVNSPETPLFLKSRVLYALSKARTHILETHEAIVCEGQIDVIRCHQAGFQTAVAAQGTAFTEEHARILKRYADSVCLVFDSDRAGQDAAVRAAGVFLETGLAVRVAALPAGEDPDSLIRKQGADAFRRVLDAAGSASAFQIRMLQARDNTPGEASVMRIAQAVLQNILRSPNAVQRARLIQEAADLLQVPINALQEDLTRMLRRSAPRAREAAPPPGPEPGQATPLQPDPKTPPPRDEVELCEHLIHVQEEPAMAALVRDYLRLDMICDRRCRAFIRAAMECAESGANLQDLLREQDAGGSELQQFAAACATAPVKVIGREMSRQDAVKDLILCVWRRHMKEERSALEHRLAQGTAATTDEARLRELPYILKKTLASWKGGAEFIRFELEHAAHSP